MYYGKMVRVNNYGKSYRRMDECVENGSITIRHSNNYMYKAKVRDNEIVEQRVWRKGKLTYAVKYGEYEKELKDGRVSHIHRYRQGTSKGYHGLTMRSDVELEGNKGRCYSFYSRGRLIWQKFIYPNKRVAYYVRMNDKEIRGVHPNGVPMFVIKVSHLYFKGKCGTPFLYLREYGRNERNFATDGLFCDYTFYDRTGRIKDHTVFENKQQVGETIRNYRTYFFITGLEVPKKLYQAKPEQIKPSSVLNIPNAQVRAMLLKKIGYERVIRECKGNIIHQDGNYSLIDFPVKYDKTEFEADRTLRILKVVCPSTKGDYFLKIPPTKDFATCQSARNGTFTGFEPNAKPITFDIET